MARALQMGIVGAGNFAAALALSLKRAGFGISWVMSRRSRASLGKAKALSQIIKCAVIQDPSAAKGADLVWFCVPDSQIAAAANSLADQLSWKGVVALHSSGALASDELAVLREMGASVASVHPLMTFVHGSRPALANVPFTIEGDAKAARTAREIVKAMGGVAYPIRKADKAAYHAWGTFASPLFTALLATTEQVARLAGVQSNAARKRMVPILLQTLANYAGNGAPAAFSGPIVRGDVETVRKHLDVLRRVPVAQQAYMALALAALDYLPAKNKAALKRLLASRQK